MNISKWILRTAMAASLLATYDCRRRNRDEDNNSTNTNTNNTPPQPQVQQPTIPAQPGMQQPGMQQPGMPAQPGMQQPGMQQPGMQQPGMPSQPGMQQPGMPTMPAPQPGMQQPGMPSADPSAQPGMGGDFISSQMTMRQQQFAQGMNPVLPLTRGNLAQGGTQNYAVQMTPGQCYKIIGVGGPGVTDLDLKLYDPAGTMVDQDIATDNFPVIGLSHQLCPQTGGQYRLEVLMYQGTGEFGVQVFGR
ncbi:MAG: hypothetical protein JNK72_22165 [Myxococcales bacterium]|nr:hypothetical protein [Myxococcales bacterium]